jgi:hypothetical protein
MTSFQQVHARTYITRHSGDRWVNETPDGPTIPVEAIADGGSVPAWLEALGLPASYAALEPLAVADGWSERRIRFVVADEGPHRLPHRGPFRPEEWVYDLDRMPLTFAHVPLVIGEVEEIRIGLAREAPFAVRQFGIGTARLYHSPLADAAWQGIVRGIFAHTSPALIERTASADRPDLLAEEIDIIRRRPTWIELQEIGLAPEPIIQNARILEHAAEGQLSAGPTELELQRAIGARVQAWLGDAAVVDIP